MWWSEGFHLEPSSARKKSMLQHVWTFFGYLSFTNFTAQICQEFHVKAFFVWSWGCPWFLFWVVFENIWLMDIFGRKGSGLPRIWQPEWVCQAQRWWTKARTWGRFYEGMRPLGRLIHPKITQFVDKENQLNQNPSMNFSVPKMWIFKGVAAIVSFGFGMGATQRNFCSPWRFWFFFSNMKSWCLDGLVFPAGGQIKKDFLEFLLLKLGEDCFSWNLGSQDFKIQHIF